MKLTALLTLALATATATAAVLPVPIAQPSASVSPPLTIQKRHFWPFATNEDQLHTGNAAVDASQDRRDYRAKIKVMYDSAYCRKVCSFEAIACDFMSLGRCKYRGEVKKGKSFYNWP